MFDGVINQGTGASTALTVSSGSLTLQRASGYTGATTLTGGTLNLNFNTSGSPANNVINATSPLVLAGGTLALSSTTSATTTADLQTFGNTTLSGSSSLQLTANTQPNNGPRNSMALNLGAITRTTGTVNVTNPAGTLSATNGVLTTSGTASSLLTDSTGAAYATVGGADWGAKDATNTFIVPLTTVGSYTGSTATALSGNADVLGNVSLSGSSTVSTLRFNSGSQTISGGTLTTGGILMTGNSGASAINGGTLKGTAGGNLTIIQNNTAINLAVGSAISDNASATAFDKSGPGTVILSGANNYTGPTNVLGGVLQFAKQTALYGNNNSLWTTPGNINVNNAATLAVNVGGTGEFTPTDVATLAALGGFQSGSALGIDTTNATGNVQLASAIANPNGGANTLGLTKLGSGTLVLAAPNTYTGLTTVAGGTLRLGGSGAGSISTSSPVSLANVAGATFDLNNNSTTLKSLSGGGSTGGTVAMGSGNLTFTGGANATFAGAVTGTGAVNVTGGSSQALTGTPGYTGATTVNTGTLSVSSASSSSIGSATKDVTIATGHPRCGHAECRRGSYADCRKHFCRIGRQCRNRRRRWNAESDRWFDYGFYSIPGRFGDRAESSPGHRQPFGRNAYSTGSHNSRHCGHRQFQRRYAAHRRAAIREVLSTPISPRWSRPVAQPSTRMEIRLRCLITLSTTPPARPSMVASTRRAQGTLTINGMNTFTGVTAVSGGTLVVQAANAASSGYAVNAANATFDLSSLGTLSLGGSQTLQGIGTVLTSGISHTAGIITGGVSGTANSVGTLTLATGNLDLAGGRVRFDLSNSSAGSNDKIEANGGLTASAASIIDIEFAALPTTVHRPIGCSITRAHRSAARRPISCLVATAGAALH